MKTYNKIYKIINGVGTLSINISKSKPSQFITFKPNFGKKVGYYITNNPLIQYKIEAHPAFGKKFVLYKKIEIETTKQSEYLQKQADTIEEQLFSFEDESSQLTIPERTLAKVMDLENRVKALEKLLGRPVISNDIEGSLEDKTKTPDVKHEFDKEAEARELQLEAESVMDDDIIVDEVKTVQEGKNYIIAYAKENDISIERRGMTSVQAVQNKAHSLGLKFPNMK